MNLPRFGGQYKTPGDPNRLELIGYQLGSQQELRITDDGDREIALLHNGRFVVCRLIPEEASSDMLHLSFLDLDTSDVTVLCPADRAPEGGSISDRYMTWVAMPPNSQYSVKDVYTHDLQTAQTVS